MVTKRWGHGTLTMALAAAFVTQAHARATNLVVERGMAEQLDPGDVVHATAPGTMAARVDPRATLDAEDASFVNEGVGTRTSRAYGVFVSDGGGLSLVGGRVAVSGSWGIGIQAQRKALLDLGGTRVAASGHAGIGIVVQREGEGAFRDLRVESTGTHGVGLLVTGHSRVVATDSRILASGSGATALALDGGEVRLRDTVLQAGPGYAIATRFQNDGAARVHLEGGAVQGRIESGGPGLSIHAVAGHIDGDAVRAGKGELDLHIARGAWRGRGSRLRSLSLSDAAWTLTGDSDVRQVRLDPGGRIVFDRLQPGFRTLRVGTWQADVAAGGVVLGTRLDAGGTLRRQATDRLLVHGDAVGRTALHVVHTGGTGASTAGRDGVNGPGDGISVVQVGGAASAESFHLAGDYVAVGPWQYRLYAYEPGRSDPAQRLVDGQGADYWDFRLQSMRTAGAASRAALAPQVPAYLVLAHALFGYGRSAMGALRPGDVGPSREPALRVRAFGGDAMYRSRLAATSYGVDYRRRDRGLQIAADMLVHAIGETTVRTGIALSSGSSRILPRAAEGRSDARAEARALAWHAVLTTESGWALASAYGFSRYRIAAHTPVRGEVLPNLRASANEAMASVGFHWRPSARLLVEPGASVLWQRLRFGKARDTDGIELAAGSPRRATVRAGARASLLLQPQGRTIRTWSPYLDLRYGLARDTGASLLAAGERLPTGRGGRTIDAAAGATFELDARWTASIDTSARLARGHGGESGRAVRIGATWHF
ncbi:autotransporter outer membrane beta-barrel domain-containing protein [Luteibacter yeojuensis]|uniref:Autotransporter outer membrane beta-barrel domain-containing protein n=1 Tax=Luteibacter yeojuensis TaxID=345309 RepID=A0A7X5QXU1_9GAMM|nr:autotransporter outer membrane beta-barrel domain-containing protein [Luteibacter yeojuensis]NID17410.1 autotransporter outer membrane beta-barrel domain-containing protein [Luteibacter yeojuensis]